MENSKKQSTNDCNVNFGKVSGKSVKVFVGDEAHKGVEIIGEKGNYSVWTDPSNSNLSEIRGYTGKLSAVKAKVASHICKAKGVKAKIAASKNKGA